MNFLKRITVLFFVTLNMFLISVLSLYVANVLVFEDVVSLLSVIYTDINARIVFAGLAAFILVMNYIFYKLFTVNVHRDKTIAFDNPEGRVSVSLVALEDLVKRTLQQVDRIKDAKSNIVASKKGLHVKVRLAIKSDVSIPTITSQVQELIKDKIQDTIGLDEKVDINVYINKIIADSTLDTKKKSKSEDKTDKGGETERSVPFHGYRG